MDVATANSTAKIPDNSVVIQKNWGGEGDEGCYNLIKPMGLFKFYWGPLKPRDYTRLRRAQGRLKASIASPWEVCAMLVRASAHNLISKLLVVHST